MYKKEVVGMKKAVWTQIVLFLSVVILGLNVGIQSVFAAGEAYYKYAIYKADGKYYSCESSGKASSMEIANAEIPYVTHVFIDTDVDTVTANQYSTMQYNNILRSLMKIQFMGNGVGKIEQKAFAGAYQGLESVVIPESVYWMGTNVFSGCKVLKNVAFMNKGTIECQDINAQIFANTNDTLRVYVYPVNENMEYITDGKVPYKTVIAPPTALKAVSADDKAVLSWNESTDATSYKVLRAESENGTYTELAEVPATKTGTNTYTDSNVFNGQQYWYRVHSMYNTSTISAWESGPVLESEPSRVTIQHVGKLYSVTYDGNGNTQGTGYAPVEYFAKDGVTVANQGSLLKEGYDFVGWNTDKEGKGTAYTVGLSFTMGKAAVTLYAQWKLKATPVTGISLDQTTMSLADGETKTLTAIITPDNATNKEVIWKSDNTAIASVTNGVVTAVGDGTTTITATTKDQAKVASCVVTVSELKYPITYELGQITDGTGVSNCITFVATIDTLEVDEVGFVFSKTNPVPVKGGANTSIKFTDKGYKSIKFMGSEFTVDTTKGNYIIACTVTGIPVVDVDKNLYVRAFATKDNKTKYTPVYIVTAKLPN